VLKRLRQLHQHYWKIAVSTVVQYFGKALQIVLSVVTIKLIASNLDQGDYGVYSAISEYALFFSTAANLGLFAHIVRAVSVAKTDKQVMVNALFLRLGSALLIFVAGLLYLLVAGVEERFFYGSVLFFGALLLDYLTSVCNAWLQANYRMAQATFALLFGKIASVVLTGVVLSVDGLSLAWYFLPTVVGSLLSFVITFWLVRYHLHGRWSLNWQLWRDLLVSSIPFGLISLANSIYFRFLPDYVAHDMLTSQQFATFSLIMRVTQVAALLSTFLMFSALPVLRQAIVKGAWEEVRTIYRRLMKVLIGVGVALLVFGTLFSSVLLHVVANAKYNRPELWFVWPLLLLLAALSYGYDLVLITLFAHEQERWWLKIELQALISAAFVYLVITYSPARGLRTVFLELVAACVLEGYMVWRGHRALQKLWRREAPAELV
jgi:O-antigen/teichoic acid export membrane protein